MRLPAVLLVLALTTAGCGSATVAARDKTGAVSSEGAVDAFAVAIGDCVQEPTGLSEQGEEIDSVHAVPCSEPHDGEAYAVFDLPDGDYPGDDEVVAAGEERCVEEFADFVGMAYEDSKYDITSIYPTRSSWEQDGDREYVCLVVAPVGERVTGSLEGARA